MSNTFKERLEPDNEKNNIIYDEHLIRYEFARGFVEGKRVLDIACGSGFGAFILAQAGAGEVVAVDSDEKAINKAKDKYPHGNIDYVVGRAEEIKEENDSFDLVVSFETIEHIKEEGHGRFLSEVKRVLRPGGLLIISTPNKDVFHERNPYHFKEYTAEELKNIIGKYFNHHKIFKQINGIATFLVSGREHGIIELSNEKAPEYFVTIASESRLEAKLPRGSMVRINQKALYNIYNNPGMKIVNGIYSLLIKIPGMKKVFEKIK